MPDVRQFALGLEGLALLRSWLVGNPTIIARHLEEMRSVLDGRAGVAEGIPIPEQTIARGYGGWAATYDAPGNPFIDIEQPVVHEILDHLPPGRALDAAGGTGRHAAHLDAHGHRVVAVDITAAMLQQLRVRAPGVRTVRGDLRALPLPNGGLDAAVCSLALTHLPELQSPMAELVRVLRPGGTLVLSDIHPVAVFLGAQAAFRGADGTRGFVRNYLHWPGVYLAAFRSTGLEILDCQEPVLRREHAPLLATTTLHTFPTLADSLSTAIDGVPAILMWHLKKA